MSIHADVVVLKDGTSLEGDVKHTDGGYDVTAKDGKVTHVGSYQIQSIQLGKSQDNGVASDRLGSLKRSVDSMSDINQIIKRYTDFIEQNKKTPAAADAEKELAIWRDRLGKGMVKVGPKWVTPEEQDQMLARVGDTVTQVQDLMKANKLKEAEPILKQALLIDPNNPQANYLQGVLAFRNEQLPLARRSFESVRSSLPGDAATLNNLGVVAWRQNQFVPAMTFYSEAMLAMPANKEILNNVAEALAGLRDEFKKQAPVQRASRLFIEQEARLEALMAQYGWYRWGSTWLDQRQLDDLKRAEKEVKDKIDKLQKDYDDLHKKFTDNETKIAKDVDFMNQIRNTVPTYQDANTGKFYPPEYPTAYYEASDEINKLQADNKVISNNLAGMRETAKRLDASKPKPKFTGLHQIIGPEGMPKIGGGRTEPDPSTQPAPAPISAPVAPATITAPATQPAAPAAPSTDRVF
jgi:tetratricopeptide (TPR) repeat protein